MNFSILFPLFFLATLHFSDTLKILIVTPFPSKSHLNFIRPVVKELATRGHDVTFYTAIPGFQNVTNIKEVIVSDPLAKSVGHPNFEMIRSFGAEPYFSPPMIWFFGLGITGALFEDSEILKLIQSDEKYDLVIAELFFFQEAFIALGHKFQAPVIALNTFSTYLYINEFVGNPFGVPYLPFDIELRYTDRMTFFQRLHNAIRTWIHLIGIHLYYMPTQDSYIRKHFTYKGAEKIPPLSDMLLQNLSLVITNSHSAVEFPRPLVPGLVGVAGVHISSKRKPLPQDLKKVMDNSKHGVIYFSFGSVVPSGEMPNEMKMAFANAFGKLKQDVLWKLDADAFPELPKNVKLSRWFPQQDILAHPNCKLFITHGGLLSHTEAVYFGVPLIGVPFFGDQFANINRGAARGFALPLDHYNITEESVLWAINEVLSKPSYRENIKKYSAIFHDNQNPPLETAVYWIEYVARHKGAPHLRVEGRTLPYYKYLLIDVILFIAVVLFIAGLILYKILKTLLSFICPNRRNDTKVNLSKKKN